MAALAILSLSGIHCVDGGGSDEGSGPNDPDGTGTTELVSWSPTATTTALPTYGNGCRYGAETVYEAPSNSLSDDNFQLVGSNGDATIFMTVQSGSGVALEAASIQLERGLLHKSYRKASGTATWGSPSQTGSIVDGTLCFSSKLDGSAAVQAEFSLVMDTGGGSYQSVSGSFSVPAEAIDTSADVNIPPLWVDVSLK
jgi:hypothetical protein